MYWYVIMTYHLGAQPSLTVNCLLCVVDSQVVHEVQYHCISNILTCLWYSICLGCRNHYEVHYPNLPSTCMLLLTCISLSTVNLYCNQAVTPLFSM